MVAQRDRQHELLQWLIWLNLSTKFFIDLFFTYFWLWKLSVQVRACVCQFKLQMCFSLQSKRHLLPTVTTEKHQQPSLVTPAVRIFGYSWCRWSQWGTSPDRSKNKHLLIQKRWKNSRQLVFRAVSTQWFNTTRSGLQRCARTSRKLKSTVYVIISQIISGPGGKLRVP